MNGKMREEKGEVGRVREDMRDCPFEDKWLCPLTTGMYRSLFCDR